MKLKNKDVDITWEDLSGLLKELCIDDLIRVNKIISSEVETRINCVCEGWLEAKKYVELK